MNWKQIAVLALGVILVLLGGLWFLQGTGIIVLSPILCVADCEPVTEPSALWAVIGAAALLGGVWLGWTAVRGLLRDRE